MRLISLTAMTGMLVGLATLAGADSALGTWQTAPDRKGQIAHVKVTRCDQALCGKIVRAYDSEGQRITTENVGKRVFWNMTRTGEGNYQGRAWVPAHDREYAAKMKLNDDRLKVSGCLGPICQSQLWARVK